MVSHDQFEYDVALSFAGEDRTVAEQIGDHLRARDLKVLFDEHHAAEPSAQASVTHIAEIFRTKARYCILLFSGHSPHKRWTEAERSDVQDHALRDAGEYILPIRLDDADVAGIHEAKGYRDLREDSVKGIADFVAQKLTETKASSGPPARSHDLRSGNIPSTHPDSE